ncbi:sodium:potassium antiporter [Sulfitobacter sp. SK012]|nr:sodium:potassium antiporter [Sulfitobacter sp. SK012]
MAFCMLGKRLASTIVTAPMVFLSLGLLMSVTGLVDHENAESVLHPVAEIALVILLFLDAAQTDLRALRLRRTWPARMLGFGLPLAIVLGTLAGFVFLTDWPFVAVILMAAIMAPTDAALGQAVVSNPEVPIRPRRALVVESGLNDGLALPVILFLASLTLGEMTQTNGAWLVFVAKQLILGPLVGVAIGWIGGQVMIYAKDHELTSETFEGIGALALAGASYLLATQIDGNGFIAAFVAGLVFGGIAQSRCKFIYEFVEGEGQILAWSAFLLLGAALVPQAMMHLTWSMFGLIMVSLLIVRPLAIWLSLLGTDTAPLTRLFFGWFGPRGLATALFALLVVEIIPHELGEQVLHIAVNTVWISAVLHGISAAPGARWYGRKIAVMGECPETQPIDDRKRHAAANS